MAYSQAQKLLIAAIFAAALLLSLLVFFGGKDEELAVSDFKGALLSSEKFSVVMDLRGASTAEGKRAVMQCGVDLAASLNLLGKNETYSFAYEGEECTQIGKIGPIADCEKQYPGSFLFRLSPGTSGSKLYKTRAEIQVPSFYEGSCIIVQSGQ